MASPSAITSLPYKRLTVEDGFDDDDIHLLQTRRRSYRFKKVVSLRRRRIRIRVRVWKLRRLLRKKAEGVRIRIWKVMKRLKESQAHFGDLFAGNYLFMQVNPTAIKYVFERSCQGQTGNFPSTLSLPRLYM